jgi:type I restriction enzyme S subunit
MIPMQWQLKPLRSVAEYQVSNVDKLVAEGEEPVRLCNYVDVYHNEVIDLAISFMPATATPGEIERFGLKVGDVLITKDSESWDDIGVPALVGETASDLVCGYHLAMIRPDADKIEGEFLLRCLQAKPVGVQLELAANGITRFGIPKTAIGSMSIPVPPLREQRRIVDYVASRVCDIDALVEAKQKLLGLLAEKRRTLVAEAVMRGLDSSVPLRPSGIDWLRDIPAHWELRRLATLFTEKDERNEPDLPLLEVSINTGVSVRQFSTTQIEGTAADFNTYKVARKGCIAFNKMRMWQGAVGVTPTDGLISPDYVVAEPSLDIDAAFAGLLFRTAAFSAECARNSVGITWDRLRLYWDGFRDISIGLPPVDEQRQIAERIGTEASKIDKLATATERSITLLKERRSALIAAAVTGQIAIPEVA